MSEEDTLMVHAASACLPRSSLLPSGRSDGLRIPTPWTYTILSNDIAPPSPPAPGFASCQLGSSAPGWLVGPAHLLAATLRGRAGLARILEHTPGARDQVSQTRSARSRVRTARARPSSRV